MIRFLCDKGYFGCSVENGAGLDAAKVEAGRPAGRPQPKTDKRPEDPE